MADDLATLGLDRYLLDTAVIDQAASDLTAWLRQETGVPVPGAVVRLGCRVVSAALFDRLKLGADRAFTGGLAVAVSGFERLPGADRFCAALRRWVSEKAEDGEARAQLEALLAGERREIDPELLQALSTDLRFQLQQVSKLDGVRNQLTAGFADILERLNPQPQLDPKLRSMTESSRLYFGARKVPFVGREAELGRLLDFTLADGDVSWWLVTGPGGMGKSRLALELCHRAGACWRTGFLPQAEIERFPWATWQPDLPHLLVVDYAAALPKAVGRMLEALRLRQHNMPLEMPVRVLLLERRREDRWWNELIAAGDRHGLAEILLDESPLQLGPLGPDGIWSMVAAIGGDAAEILGRDSVLERLTAIDPAMRPLFAALAGEALAAGANLWQWTRTDLLEDWLKRERERHWQPAGVDEPHANLAALATMVGGIAEDVLAHPPDGIALPPAEDISVSTYAAVTGWAPLLDSNGTTWFAAVEPDLLGTFLVLRHLESPCGRSLALASTVMERADRYRRAAWARGGMDALNFASFLNRAMDDFSEYRTFAPLLKCPHENRWSRTLWAMITVNLTICLYKAQRMDDASSVLDRLQELASEYSDEPALRFHLAQGWSNLIGFLGDPRRLDEAGVILGRLQHLVADHPTEPELKRLLAGGSRNLIVNFAHARRNDEASALLNQLEKLAANYPNEPALRREFADATVSLVGQLKDAIELNEASSLVDRLRTLSNGYPREPELRLGLAKSTFNLISNLANAQRLDEAHTQLDRVETLSKDHPNEPALRQELADCSVNLINAFGSVGQFDEANTLLEQLRGLAHRYPLEQELQLKVAQGSVNLINALGSAGKIDEAKALLGQLQALADNHPDEPELRLPFARGSFNLIDALRSAGKIDEAEALLEQLQSLADHHPRESELRLWVARGTANLITHFSLTGRIGEAKALLEQLQGLASKDPDDIQIIVAGGLAAISVLLTQGQREGAEGARATVRSAEGLLRHPAVIAEMQQRYGQDRARQLEQLIGALLNDDWSGGPRGH